MEETQQTLPVKWSRTSKRGALMRIIRDLQRFNEDQLKVLIDMAHKVRRAKHQLALVALNAEELMRSMPEGRVISSEGQVESWVETGQSPE